MKQNRHSEFNSESHHPNKNILLDVMPGQARQDVYRSYLILIRSKELSTELQILWNRLPTTKQFLFLQLDNKPWLEEKNHYPYYKI